MGYTPKVSDVGLELLGARHSLRLREDGVVSREEKVEEELQQTRVLVLPTHCQLPLHIKGS